MLIVTVVISNSNWMPFVTVIKSKGDRCQMLMMTIVKC